MKKLNCINFMILLISLLVLAACGSGAESSSNDKEVITLKYNSTFTPPTKKSEPTSIITEKFAELVEERTDGRLKIDLYYSNQLAGQAESLDALAKGTIDIQNITPSAWGDKIPEGNFSGLPFWNINEEHTMYIMRETEVGELYEEAMEEYGVKVLSYWAGSGNGYMSAKSPIASPADMEGLIANINTSMSIGYYEEMGVGVATIPFAEQYEGLQRGTIDFINFPYFTLEKLKLAEVVDYIMTPSTINPALAMLAINKDTLEGLPEDLREILIETALEMESETLVASKEVTVEALEYAKENDVQIIDTTEDNYNEFIEIGKRTAWDSFSKQNDRTKKMVDVLNSETEKWKEDNPDLVQETNELFTD